MKGKWFKKWLTISLALILTLTMAPGAFAADVSSKNHTISLNDSGVKASADKINTDLAKAFDQDEFVTYLVQMNEQVDVNSVANDAKSKNYMNSMSPAMQKISIRNSVVSALRDTASRTQFDLSRFLESQKSAGNVKDYKGYYIVNMMVVTSTKAVMEKISSRMDVAALYPNRTIQLDVLPKTPEVSTQGQAPNSIEWNIDRVGAPAVWGLGIDGTGVVVANLDTGVQLDHPALQRKWRGNQEGMAQFSWYDATSENMPQPFDGHGHGTHTMGTMVGSEANGSNQIGVAPGAQWMAVRIFDSGGSATDQGILDGGQWLVAPTDAQGNPHPEYAPDVVNNSWGSTVPGFDPWFQGVVQAWRAAQIYPSFSAGNVRASNPGGPGSVSSPGNYPESVAVGATDINNNLASFSLLGPAPVTGEMKPEVSAPGVNVRSSVPGSGYEGGWSGTSMAAPHNTATAALLLQANASLTVDELEEIIKNTATPLTNGAYPESPNNGFGWGLVNAFDAVSSVISGLGSVSGRVSTTGDDFEPPVLNHTPITFAFSGMDVPLSAEVTDNVGVTTVEAFARSEGFPYYIYVPMQQTSGDYKGGQYEGSIPAFLLDYGSVEYYLRVNDYGNNGYESTHYTFEVSDGIEPGYIQDFENDDFGFQHGGDNDLWQWGVPTSGPLAAHSGEKVFATNLAGAYSSNTNAYLLLPPINLRDNAGGAILSFWHWFELENGYDNGTVYIASPQSGYEFVPVLNFTGDGKSWRKQMIDLNDYAGEQIFVLFNMTSDGSVQKNGWYLDDFAIIGPDEVAPTAPTGLTHNTDATGNVNLSWNANTEEDLKEYNVYRSNTSGSGYALLGTTPTTSFQDHLDASGTYYYVVSAVDYSLNESGYSAEDVVTISAPEVIFGDNFDGDTDNGWTHGGTQDQWERGAPTSGPGNAASAPNVWATNLAGNYNSSADNWLLSPVIDLTGRTNATLIFDHWFELETNYDKGKVEITNNGGSSWTKVAEFSHSTNGKQWSNASINLDSYAGQSIQVRFHMTSDSSINKLGWYLDNFRVLSVNAPTNVTVNPAKSIVSGMKKEVQYEVPFKIHRTTEQMYKNVKPEGNVSINSLPADAIVSIVETGRSTNTNPANGRFSMIHAAGDYTLRAEMYGYYTAEQPITIADDQNTVANFVLQPKPHGFISGQITDERSGEPIANSTVMVMEDARISPVQSDENGFYSLDVLAGEYTVSVSAPEYNSKKIFNVVVPANETVTVDVQLKPFIGYEGMLVYDDGSAENARAFYDAGNGWAVRMTPEQGSAQVSGALFRFWDTSWPSPGGTAFQYAVFDANGADGSPGNMLAGPFNGVAKRDGTWTEVNFETPVTVEGDFYIAYIQAAPYPNSPGLATDEDGEYFARSYQRVGGAWSQSPADEGNYMIRAIVKYPVGAPVITSPVDGFATNNASITVTGTSPANGSTVKIQDNGVEVGSGTIENGQFSVDITLQAGENSLTAVVEVNGKLSDTSEPVVVILDQTAPSLTVVDPVQGFKTNKEVVYVTGAAADNYFDKLTVNGQSVDLRANGTFSTRVLVNAGDNLITVRAVDRAGNETVVNRTVHVVLNPPSISNIQPATDVHLTGGQTLNVSFDSASGLSASFRVELDLGSSGVNASSITMTETSPGHYEGSWTTPSTLNISGASIVVRAQDDHGNYSETVAPGKLYVAPAGGGGGGGGGSDPSPNPPSVQIQGATSGKVMKTLLFAATGSSNIVSYSWSFGDGSSASGATVGHKFTSAGTYTITVTVTDSNGLSSSASHTITVR